MVLLAIAMVAAYAVYREIDSKPEFGAAGLPASMPAAETFAPTAEESPFTMAPLVEFAAIVERPLFNETRRPMEPAAEAPTLAPGKIERNLFALRGIIISADERVALVEFVKTRELMRLAEGQEVHGWRLEAILPDRVIFGQGDLTEEVELKDSARPRAPQGQVKIKRKQERKQPKQN